jgi:hypothetical protein
MQQQLEFEKFRPAWLREQPKPKRKKDRAAKQPAVVQRQTVDGKAAAAGD